MKSTQRNNEIGRLINNREIIRSIYAIDDDDYDKDDDGDGADNDEEIMMMIMF